MATLARLYEERDPLYREVAHVVMDTGNQSLSSLAHRLEPGRDVGSGRQVGKDRDVVARAGAPTQHLRSHSG